MRGDADLGLSLDIRYPGAYCCKMAADQSHDISSGHRDDLEHQAIEVFLSGDEEASAELWERAQLENLRGQFTEGLPTEAVELHASYRATVHTTRR